MKKIISKISKHPMITKWIKPLYLYFKDKPFIRKYEDTEKCSGKIYVSYLTEPFRKINDTEYLNKHQNRRETILLGKILNSLNLYATFERFDRTSIISNKYDLIFGLEPNFIKAAKANPDALKIYYATGAYWNHQNNMIKLRTREFNESHGCKVKESRLVPIHNAPEIADYIIQIGSKYTIETYPENLRSKIRTIRQTCHEFKFKDYLARKLESFNSNEFVWMGSNGSILKGFDLVVDYFIGHPELKLHIVGPIDPDVKEYYSKILRKHNNVIIHGFLDLDSDDLEEIGLHSAFIIMPSASEGCPGSVINMMKLGCIPIVSKYAAFDEIEQYGFIIHSFSLESLGDAINDATSLNQKEISNLCKQNFEFANNNFNQANFENDMIQALSEALKNYFK